MDGDDAHGQIVVCHVLEARFTHPALEFFLLREHTDGFDEVLVAVAILRHQLTNFWNQCKRIFVVEFGQHRDDDLRKFEAEELPAGLERAVRIAQRLGDIRDVAQAEGDGDDIERPVSDGKRFCIATNPPEALRFALIELAVSADIQHRFVDVAHGDGSAGFVLEAHGNIARAACEIEDGGGGGDIDARDEIVLPHTVHAGAHQVVHDVVTAGNGGKYFTHHGCFRICFHFAETEIRGWRILCVLRLLLLFVGAHVITFERMLVAGFREARNDE